MLRYGVYLKKYQENNLTVCSVVPPVWVASQKFIFTCCCNRYESRSSSVSIVTSLRDRRPGFNFPMGWARNIFTSPPCLDQNWGPTQPPIQWVPESLSSEVKQLGREADHLPPSSVEIENAWRCTYTLSYVFMTWCLVKKRIHLHGMIIGFAQGHLYLLPL
jgi:hypothetical protein